MLKQIIKLNSNYSNFILIFLALSIAFSLVYYKEIDAKDLKNEKIDLCCTWGKELKDDVLTFNIEKGNKDLEKITKSAFSEWENNLNQIYFKNVKDNNNVADIQIKFKKGNINQGGEAKIYFDQKGFIDYVKIFVSKTSNGTELNQTIVERIIKHEIGHALGLGHSPFPHSIMYPIVDEAVMKISICEIDAVKDANNWKFIKNDKKPKMLEQSVYICK